MARVYNHSIKRGEGSGRTWGGDYGDISLPWQEVETGHHTANLSDILGNAWATIRQDSEFYGSSRNYEEG